MTAMQEQHEPEVGAIPAGWSIAALGDLGSCIRGVSYKPEHLMQRTGEGVTTLLRSNNIKNDRVNFDDVQFVAGCKISENQLARPFDIAICMSNGSKALVGKSGVVTPAHLARHPRLTVGAFCAIYRSPVRYTAQIFKSQFFQSAIDVQLAGSAINNLKGSDIEGIRFPLPPREEQQGIAAILTAVDDKLDVIARQIEATQTLKQGLMQTLFSRGVGTADASGRWVPHREFQSSEMGEVPATWRMSTLGECSKVIYRYPGFYGFEPLSEGVPVVRGEHIKNGRLSTEWSNYWYVTDKDSEDFPKTVLEEGDIVMAVRGTVGNFAIVGPEHIGAQISPNLIRISPDHKIVDRAFFYFQMDLSATLLKKSFVQSQALPSLSAADIKRIAMPIPPIQEQRKIGEILGAVETKLAALSARQSAFKQLKQGLMQKLLTGEWRVKVDAKMDA